ncbi:MAG: sensor histidine kinase [Chloroflexota bacterium]
MNRIVRNATRILRAVLLFRLFIVAFGVVVFTIRWAVQSPLETLESSTFFGPSMLAMTVVTALFLFLPGLEKRMGRAYLPTALGLTILASSLESGMAYLHPGAHLLITLPSGRAFSIFWASTEIVLTTLIPCVLAGAVYGLRGAIGSASLATALHLATGIIVWLLDVPPLGFLALLPLRLAVLYGFPFIAGYLADTWRREHAAVVEANRQLRGYAATVENLATFRERVRLAREMHDTLAHSLSAVVVQLEAIDALQSSDPAAAHEQLAKVRHQARLGLDEARRAIQNLRTNPVEELGLVGAMAQLTAQFGRRNGIHTDWAVVGEPAPLLPVQANALYRMAEEALSNVERHAAAGRVAVSLCYAEGVTLTVQDDGRGFDPDIVDSDRFGLVGIRERAALVDGRVTVESTPGEGTTLTVQIVEPWED